MEKIVNRLRKDFPALTFKPAAKASWSPRLQQITYTNNSSTSTWALLHELGHALCGHSSYHSDIMLLRKETEAWDKAQELSDKYKLPIDDDHIQSCLDTYRDWLHKRSTCPSCDSHGVQSSPEQYNCYNCNAAWHVGSERFCRAYRSLQPTKIK